MWYGLWVKKGGCNFTWNWLQCQVWFMYHANLIHLLIMLILCRVCSTKSGQLLACISYTLVLFSSCESYIPPVSHGTRLFTFWPSGYHLPHLNVSKGPKIRYHIVYKLGLPLLWLGIACVCPFFLIFFGKVDTEAAVYEIECSFFFQHIQWLFFYVVHF